MTPVENISTVAEEEGIPPHSNTRCLFSAHGCQDMQQDRSEQLLKAAWLLRVDHDLTTQEGTKEDTRASVCL